MLQSETNCHATATAFPLHALAHLFHASVSFTLPQGAFYDHTPNRTKGSDLKCNDNA